MAEKHKSDKKEKKDVKENKKATTPRTPKEKKANAKTDKEKALILWFEDLTNDDVAYVGGKNASLGEMYKELTPKGIKIPNGFAVTAYAYNHFLDECNLMDDLSEALEGAHVESRDLKKVGKKVRKLILEAEFPEDLSKAIVEAYKKLGGGDVAVRSSATAEDLPEASFAGQQESYLNVEGEEMVLEACKKCMASLFTNRAISYREDKGFNHFDVYLSVGVMKMVRSDKGCAGTMFTIDTETGFSNTVIINGNWGLGENVVQGSVNPDEWTVFKPTLDKEKYKPIIRKMIGSKKQFMVYGGEGTTSTVNMETSKEHQEKFCLEDDEVLQLAKWGGMIEDHYSKRKGKDCPMDIEWAKDGNTNEIFIVQARPETVQSQKNRNMLVTFKLKGKRKVDDLDEVTEENAEDMKKGKGGKADDKEAEKAKSKLGKEGKEKSGKDKTGKGIKDEGEGDADEEAKPKKEGTSKKPKDDKKPKKGKEKEESGEDDDGESEDDLKLTTPKKHKTEKKQDNELIKKSEEEGKGEKKEGESYVAKDKDNKEKGPKDKSKKEKGDEEKEAKPKGEDNVNKGKEKEKRTKGDYKGKKDGSDKKESKEGSSKDGKDGKGDEKGDEAEADSGKIAMARHKEFEKDKGDKDDKGDKKGKKDSEKPKEAEEVLTSGAAVGSGIAAGKARKILSVSKLKEFNKGEILVTEMTDPDWEPILKLAAAIVTDSGGRTCHAAIIARELGIPCIVGCSDATSKIETDDPVTVDCARGDQGVVLDGLYDFERTEQDLGDLTETKTKIMMNVANPDTALELSFIPNSGVGLGRLEFIVNNHIGIHPLAVLHMDDLEEEEKQKVLEKSHGYKDPREFFVSTLSHGVGMIAAAFYPKPVIVRFSDFKTNEYANLLGGKYYEPKEDNPMLGWRGASRYYDPTYREGFALECEAMKRVREVFGLTNLRLMIPMLRTVEEAKRVLEEMESNGIKKSEGKDGLKVMAMCEVPANVILAEQFLELLDGFSIGSNDLTQMTLGVDRDSEIVNDIFDERNDAVKTMIAHAISVCRKLKKYVGICGQAPSDYPEFAEWLVDQGIESMSLNPDTVLATSLLVSKRERGLTDEEFEKEKKEKEKSRGKKEKGEGKKEKEKEGADKKEKGKEDNENNKSEKKEAVKDKEAKSASPKENGEKESAEKTDKEKTPKKSAKPEQSESKDAEKGTKKPTKQENKDEEADKPKEKTESKDEEKDERKADTEEDKNKRIEEIHKQLDEVSAKVEGLSNELHELTVDKDSKQSKPAM